MSNKITITLSLDEGGDVSIEAKFDPPFGVEPITAVDEVFTKIMSAVKGEALDEEDFSGDAKWRG